MRFKTLFVYVAMHTMVTTNNNIYVYNIYVYTSFDRVASLIKKTRHTNRVINVLFHDYISPAISLGGSTSTINNILLIYSTTNIV